MASPWTKLWSASDNGTILTGAHLGTIQSDIESYFVSISGTPARGDIIYYDGSNYSLLNAGTSGYYLQTKGSGADPVWAAALDEKVKASSGDTAGYLDAKVDDSTIEVSSNKLQSKLLKGSYDSGWFQVTTSTTYQKTHNLGTTKILVQVWANSSASDTNAQLIVTQLERQNSDDNDIACCGLRIDDTNNISLHTGNEQVAFIMNFSTSEPANIATGSAYYKVIILALA